MSIGFFEVIFFPIMVLIVLMLLLQIAVWLMKHVALGYRYQSRDYLAVRHHTIAPAIPVVPPIIHPVPIVGREPPGEVEIRLDLTRMKRERG